MKICFICSEYPPGPHGGIGTMTQVIGRALAAQGHEVRVVGVYPKSYPGPDYQEDMGVRVWRLRSRGVRFGWIQDRRRLFHMVREWASDSQIDVVEVPDFEGWAAGWGPLAVPVVARLHGTGTYFNAEMKLRTARLNFWVERASLRRANFWASVCRYTASRTQELFGLQVASTILYNPVEKTSQERR